MKTHYTIPIFIPGKACPFQCVYCNQVSIADQETTPKPEEIREIIERYLSTIPTTGYIRLAFFGGSFTGMSIEEQNCYLEVAYPYIQRGIISEIQLSTRPDFINQEILSNLKRYKVRIIELGAQSLDSEVLRAAGRGHTVNDVEKASALILSNGFELGLQMMIGLPLDTIDKSLRTAHKIIELGAKYTRIYPTLVVKNTYLEKMYLSGQYVPLTLEKAVSWCSKLLLMFESAQVTVLRLGLHPSEGLLSGRNMLAGPFHVSFKELVNTEIWGELLQKSVHSLSGDGLVITVSPTQLNAAIGYGGKNRNMLQKQYKVVSFRTDTTLQGRQFVIEN